ncbi:hypothetical protein, partial [Escherichia coli]|uniref:hypothetical protein n=1 Tax=Escherichia coli TaxID=562 RepID=UPI001F14E1A5
NRSHWSTSKTPSYTKSVSWQHHPIIDSFSASVINMLITEGGCLLKTDELIGFHLNYWKPNNFRLISIWYLM